jgi:hypothetical protein
LRGAVVDLVSSSGHPGRQRRRLVSARRARSGGRRNGARSADCVAAHLPRLLVGAPRRSRADSARRRRELTAAHARQTLRLIGAHEMPTCETTNSLPLIQLALAGEQVDLADTAMGSPAHRCSITASRSPASSSRSTASAPSSAAGLRPTPRSSTPARPSCTSSATSSLPTAGNRSPGQQLVPHPARRASEGALMETGTPPATTDLWASTCLDASRKP